MLIHSCQTSASSTERRRCILCLSVPAARAACVGAQHHCHQHQQLSLIAACPDALKPCQHADAEFRAPLHHVDSMMCAMGWQLHILFAHHFIRHDQVTALARSGVPILVIVATEDRLIPPQHQYEVVRRLEAASLELDTGHMMASRITEVADCMSQHIHAAGSAPQSSL